MYGLQHDVRPPLTVTTLVAGTRLGGTGFQSWKRRFFMLRCVEKPHLACARVSRGSRDSLHTPSACRSPMTQLVHRDDFTLSYYKDPTDIPDGEKGALDLGVPELVVHGPAAVEDAASEDVKWPSASSPVSTRKERPPMRPCARAPVEAIEVHVWAVPFDGCETGLALPINTVTGPCSIPRPRECGPRLLEPLGCLPLTLSCHAAGHSGCCSDRGTDALLVLRHSRPGSDPGGCTCTTRTCGQQARLGREGELRPVPGGALALDMISRSSRRASGGTFKTPLPCRCGLTQTETVPCTCQWRPRRRAKIGWK